MWQIAKKINRNTLPFSSRRRKGAIVVLTALLLLPLMAMLALSVDYGYLHVVRGDLQRSADAAALAAAQELIPDSEGLQDTYAAKQVAVNYVQLNVKNVPNFIVPDSDIVIGTYDPATGTLASTGGALANAVRVTLRREAYVNGEVPLFFARVLGFPTSPMHVSATAYLPPGRFLRPGTGILPFSIPVDVWSGRSFGDVWSIYGDGKLKDDNGQEIPGNWGTLDIGESNNSTADLRDQILEGLRQSDLDALYADGRIATNLYIDSAEPFYANGDPGLSSGIKNAVQQVEGMTKLIPLYDSVSGNGANVEFHVVGWGVVQVVDSKWGGAKNTYVKIKKFYTYDGHLTAPSDLRDQSGVVEGAYAGPVLVE